MLLIKFKIMWKEVKFLAKQARAGVPNALNGGTLTPIRNNPEQTRSRARGTIVKSKETGIKYRLLDSMESDYYEFSRYPLQKKINKGFSKLEELANKQRPTYVSMARQRIQKIQKTLEDTNISISGDNFSKLGSRLLREAEELEEKREQYDKTMKEIYLLSRDIRAVSNAAKYKMATEELQTHNQRRGATRGAQLTFA